MRLWIIRHGKADKESPTGRDEHRLLRDRGRRQAKWLGAALRQSDAPPSSILSSGLLRAIETARIIQGVLGCPLLVEPALETGHPASDVLEALTAHERATSIAVVGHNPQLESLLALLVAGCAATPARLRTGEAVGLDLPHPSHTPGNASLVGVLRLEEEPAEPDP